MVNANAQDQTPQRVAVPESGSSIFANENNDDARSVGGIECINSLRGY